LTKPLLSELLKTCNDLTPGPYWTIGRKTGACGYVERKAMAIRELLLETGP
jgi:hypothetical protein